MAKQKLIFLRKALFITLNVLILNAVGLTALIFFFDAVPETRRFLIVLFEVSVVPAIALLLPILSQRTLYQDRTVLITFKAITVLTATYVCLLWIAGILTAMTLGKVLILYLLLLAADTFAMLIFRMVLKNYRRRGADSADILIIGKGTTASLLEKELRINSDYGYHIAGYVADSPDKSMTTPWLGTKDNLEEIVKKVHPQEIYYVMDNDEPERINDTVRLCDNLFIRLFFIPSLGNLAHRRYNIPDSSIGFLTLGFKPERLGSPFNRATKRMFDLTISSLVIALLAVPVFLPVAKAIKRSSPGPEFFRQRRNGYHGKEFICYKFRSMVVNDGSETESTRRNDDRITRVGRFLRRTSIDELPQFFNVIKGDMSVVGPRPHIPRQTEEYTKIINNYMVRHLIKPGITGWAQINRLRGTAESLEVMEARVKADLWYIDNWSTILDLKIILRTAYNILFTRDDNAY